VRLGGVCGIERGRLEDLLGDVGRGRGAEDLALKNMVSIDAFGQRLARDTQLVWGSRNLQKTPSSNTSFMRRHLLRKMASMRFRSSMTPASSFAFVGFAA
jgi:hypothetical protein